MVSQTNYVCIDQLTILPCLLIRLGVGFGFSQIIKEKKKTKIKEIYAIVQERILSPQKVTLRD